MSGVTDTAKRILLGRPMRSEKLGETLLPKRLALPIFASDALSSVAYAPDEILLTLAVAGVAASTISLWAGLGVVFVMAIVVLSYRQNVHAYPTGGGNYEVVTKNISKPAGLTVASSLMVDYTLTVAVSISSAAAYAASALPALHGHETTVAVGAVVLLTLMNLRGTRESGRVFAVPTYLFMGLIGLMAVVGTIRYFSGTLPMAESAQFTIASQSGFEQGLIGFGGAFLFARAFASGCAALTGVEAISNGVPVFQKPKSRNAAATLVMLGGISAFMMIAILLLAQTTGVRFVENPHTQLLLNGGPIPDTYQQHPTIGQLAAAVFQGFPVAFYAVAIVTGLILMFAANTAFNGFPVLGSILAKDGYLPHQLHTRGNRLAFSNGILALAAAAIILIVTFNASVSRLIQLYIVGVFISFTLSQLGMIRHWTRELKRVGDKATRARMQRSRVVNYIGFAATGFVLLVVLVTKFVRGAWLALLVMAVLYLLMRAVRTHYTKVASEIDLPDERSEERHNDEINAARVLPSRVHAIVLVSKVHQPLMRAVAYARATRPSVLEAVNVQVDLDETAELLARWEALNLPVPLRVLDSPYREIVRPVIEYIRSIRRDSPRDLVVVYIPEYVVGHWWQQILHNQSALRLKTHLHFIPGVVVASVPWQLESTRGARGIEEPELVDNRQ